MQNPGKLPQYESHYCDRTLFTSATGLPTRLLFLVAMRSLYNPIK